MSKFVHSDVLDGGLTAIKNATVMMLISAYAPGDTYATVTGNKIAQASMASTDYTLASSGNNRTLTTATGKTGVASAANVQLDNGTATSGSTTTLTNTAKAWTVNAFAGKVVTIVSGTGAGQEAVITSNTATALTFPAVTTAPDATSVYRINNNLHIAFTDGSAKVLWVTDETSELPNASGDTIGFPSLVYTNVQPV